MAITRRNLTIAGLHHPDVDVENIYRLFPILKQRGAQMASSLSGVGRGPSLGD